ncbi:MAG: Ig-like domain-containing protein [Myxococcota bacterium]|nr:Ig-like domain-containing protein [Myxococcota bacterium]
MAADRTAAVLYLLGCFAVIGCTSESTNTTDQCVEPWASHYGARFLAGETFYLPKVRPDGPCRSARWTLVDAPATNAADVQTAATLTRFNPMVPGRFKFDLTAGDGARVLAEVMLTVIDPLSRPFHNYNYFPAPNAGVAIGDILWVAGVYTPQIARFDTKTGEAQEPILVGQWPTSLAYVDTLNQVLVTNKASDTLGFVDVATGRQVDSIWVGDEPASVIYNADSGHAYISLSGANSVAVVDVADRQLIKTIPVVFDPLAIALSPDGERVAVASHRSGQVDMYPYDDRSVTEEKDIAIIDTMSLEVKSHILDVASTIHAMDFNRDGALRLIGTINRIEGPLNDVDTESFQHRILEFENDSGTATPTVSIDLSRQASSTGSTGTLHGFVECGGSFWVVAEGSDSLLKLDSDYQEVARISVTGRPRVVQCVNGTPYVVASNRMTVTKIDGEPEPQSLGLTERRHPLLIEGLERFTGQGDGPADNRSCNNCHVDGLTDRVIWNAGPVVSRLMTRPLRWLEGTDMIGWDGYVGSVRISGYVGGSTINRRGNTQESEQLGAYLASLMPSPPANSLTRRDGSLSEQAQRGKRLFETEAGCSGCHLGPLTTSRLVLPDGLTPGQTDIPSLIDVARIGSWYKTGAMTSLADTVIDTAEKFGRPLSDPEVADVVRYLGELTGREFFPLKVDFGPDSNRFPIDGEIKITFSYPMLDVQANLAIAKLISNTGNEMPVEHRVDGRDLFIKPESRLAADQGYQLQIEKGFLGDHGVPLDDDFIAPFKTAAGSELILEGDYKVTIKVPMFDFNTGEFDWDNLVDQSFKLNAVPTAQGARTILDFGGDMVYETTVVLDGEFIYTEHLPIAVGPSFLNGSPMVGALVDSDSDGIVDGISGRLTLTGPGIELPDLNFQFEVDTPGGCEVGTQGDAAPMIQRDGESVSIDWGTGGALAFFVTTPDATLPLGPGVVDGGQTFWALSASDFPNTFNGPIIYGVTPDGALDITADNGGSTGGIPLESGQCYRFSVVVDFAYSHTTLIWP